MGENRGFCGQKLGEGLTVKFRRELLGIMGNFHKLIVIVVT